MLISIKTRDGTDCAMLSLIFMRTMKATDIIAVNPAEAKRPMYGKFKPVNSPAAPNTCKTPVILRCGSVRPNRLNSAIINCENKA